MKKNSFDPFMINNFSNVIKQSRSVSISTNEPIDGDMIGVTFLEKSSSMRIPKVRAGLIILVTSNSLGKDNELGVDLIKNLFISVASGLELPEYIFLINEGVKLVENNDVLESFKKIKKYGTNIVTSMESLNYFKMEGCKLAQKWSIGDITTALVNSNNVIKV